MVAQTETKTDGQIMKTILQFYVCVPEYLKQADLLERKNFNSFIADFHSYLARLAIETYLRHIIVHD